MSKFTLQCPAGLTSDDTRLAAKGRWVDASNVRFWEAKPQVVGGWESIIGDLLSGVCRTAFQWSDKAASLNIGLGTHSDLQVWVGGSLVTVTPLLALPAALLGPSALSVTSGTPNVVVTQRGHPFAIGEAIIISAAVAVGGITPNMTAIVTAVTVDTWTYVYTSNAASTATGGGSAIISTPQRAFAPGAIDGTGGAGYGTGAFGVGTFGSPSITDYFPRTWALGAWGENLVAAPRGGTAYQWSNDLAARALPISNAPTRMRALLVAPTDQLFALGCNEEVSGIYNPLCIRHCSVRNITEWSTGAATTAREYTLPGGGEIVAGRMCGAYMLVWTTAALFVGTFVGNLAQPWRFDRVGEHCGLIGPNAAVVVGQRALWLSPDLQFRTYSLGGEPALMQCPIRADMVENITPSQADKIVASSVSAFGEVRFDYPDVRDGYENSRYLSVSVVDGAWSKGLMARTAFCDATPSESPIGVTAAGNLYWHERGHSADGGPFGWFIETGELYMDDEITTMVRGLWPDISNQLGAWVLTLFSRLKPNDQAPRAFGPYAISATDDQVDIRASGRLFRIRFEGFSAVTGGRLGLPIFDVKGSSRR